MDDYKKLKEQVQRALEHYDIAQAGEMYTNDKDLVNSIVQILREALAQPIS